MANQPLPLVNLLERAPEKCTSDSDTYKDPRAEDDDNSRNARGVRVFRVPVGNVQMLLEFDVQQSLIQENRNICTARVVDAVTAFGVVKAVTRRWFEGESILGHVQTEKAVDKFLLIYQIASGLESLHTQGIVHGNLHPGNIFVTAEGTVCITDAGVHMLVNRASFESEGRVRIPRECIYKSREELNLDDTVDGLVQHTTAMDVFSWGATAFAITIEKAPFIVCPTLYIANFASTSFGTMQKPSQMSNGLWQLLQRCWHENPTLRPSMTEVVESLNALRSADWN